MQSHDRSYLCTAELGLREPASNHDPMIKTLSPMQPGNAPYDLSAGLTFIPTGNPSGVNSILMNMPHLRDLMAPRAPRRPRTWLLAKPRCQGTRRQVAKIPRHLAAWHAWHSLVFKG